MVSDDLPPHVCFPDDVWVSLLLSLLCCPILIHANEPFPLSCSLEKYGKVSKRVGKVKKSIFHPHAAKADREKEEREKKEHEEAIAKAAAQTGEPVDKKRSLADFKRDILYGRRKDETVEGAKKLAAKIGVDVEESKGEEEKQGREPSSNDKTQPSSDNDNAPAVDTTLSPADLPSPSSAKKDD